MFIANIRLLAPAGLGKTYSLLWRCRFITDECEKNGSPQPRFLILTFTRAARFELEDRMKKNPAFAGIHATVRTLNSWGWEQYRRAGKTMSTKQKQNKYAGDIIDLIDLLKSLGFVHTMNKRDYKRHVKYVTKLGLYPNLQEGYSKLWKLQNISDEKTPVKEEAEWSFIPGY